jgi:hypothetical protein
MFLVSFEEALLVLLAPHCAADFRAEMVVPPESINFYL